MATDINASRDPDFTGQVVIVTGAGQGIGRVYAHRFARAGAQDVVAEINTDQGRAVVDEITGAGGKAVFCSTDVGDPASVDAMVEQTLANFGRIDVLINNAALYTALTRATFDALPLDEWDAVMRVNVTGPYLCARAVAPAMRAARYGRIINISSGTVTMGRPNFLHYVTSKSAVIGMARSLARELGEFGVTVNVVVPGLIRTEVDAAGATDAVWQTILDRQCLKREGTPDDIADAVLFLASAAAGFVTGQSLASDGGATHL
ncbi:MAG: 3-oxoacyl-ACP reductase FabG [Marinosulfonomonas sp.]|nr:3-oxoacyl-ACP reductase FabG [Marinosulfonomonas sp.]